VVPVPPLLIGTVPRERAPVTASRDKGAPAETAMVPSALGRVNIVVRKNPDGGMQVVDRDIPEMPGELKQVIEEQR